MKPSICAITISYNQSHFLKRTIQSVLGQTSPCDKYIVIDGGSTDGSVDVIREFGSAISYWISEPDKGPADALNKALAHVESDFFYYLNSDDLILPDAFSRARVLLSDAPQVDVLFGDGITLDERTSPPSYSRRFSDNWNTRKYVEGNVSIVQQSTFIRTSIARDVGGFNVQNRSCWDGELLFDAAQAGAKFMRVAEIFGVFRLHGTSISGVAQNHAQYAKDVDRILQKYLASGNLPVHVNSTPWRRRLRNPVASLRRASKRLFQGRIPVPMKQLVCQIDKQ